MNQYDDEALFEEDPEPVEGYCVRCRETVEIENPTPVWTRKGMPATRGDCSQCGGTVFRMGKTDAHSGSNRPAAVQVSETDGKRKIPLLTKDTVYVNYALADFEAAQRLAESLNNAGISAWLHAGEGEEVNWAGGVHPALKQCDRMVFVLSPDALEDAQVAEAWQFFREKRKPIVLAQIAPADPPDAIRRSPRFDFSQEDGFKSSFRQMLQALSS